MIENPKPEVHSFFDENTNAACYIVKDPTSNSCAVIDSILDFDLASGRTHTNHADMLIQEIKTNDWKLDWVIETHVHADHLSAAPYLAKQLGGKIAIGANIESVQKYLEKFLMQVLNFKWMEANLTNFLRMATSFKLEI